MAKIYLLLIIGSIIGGTGYGIYRYWKWSTDTISTLEQNNAKLTTANTVLQETIKRQSADAVRNERLNNDLSYRLQDAEESLNTLRRIFSEVDLTEDALNDADDLEKRVNNAADEFINNIQVETTPPGRNPPPPPADRLYQTGR